jgi:hypothetical protein
MSKGRQVVDREVAEAMAAHALGFLASEPQRFARFLALTGVDLDEVRANASSPELLAAVLAHLNSDESLLLTFAAVAHSAPATIGPALAILQGHPLE